jgi:hypothetical protein
MNGKRYSLHARPSKRSRTGEVYYVQFKLSDGSYSTAKSSGQATEGAAKTWADNYLASGQVVTKENVSFGTFASGFFDWEGEYAKHKRMRGKNVSVRQLHEQALHLKNHVMPHFRKMKLTQIDYDVISDFQFGKLEAGLSGSSVNKLTGILKAILEHALRKKLIQAMPLIERVGDQPKQRGVLTVEEAKAVLFDVTWPEYRCYVANLTAAFTGLRQGEVIALQRQDVEMASSLDPYTENNFDPGGKNYFSFLFWILYDSPRRENVCA